MTIRSIPKARTNARLLTDARAFAASAEYGPRSGAVGTESRARAEAMTEAVFIAIAGGGAVEVTSLFDASGKVNEYHLAHTASRPAEVRVGKNVDVVMFTEVTKETSRVIEGVTATSKGHGRVFVIPKGLA